MACTSAQWSVAGVCRMRSERRVRDWGLDEGKGDSTRRGKLGGGGCLASLEPAGRVIGGAVVREASHERVLCPTTDQQCSQDALQFKGIFIRYLGVLLDLAARVPSAAAALGGARVLRRLADFVHSNAESVWSAWRHRPHCLLASTACCSVLARLQELNGSGCAIFLVAGTRRRAQPLRRWVWAKWRQHFPCLARRGSACEFFVLIYFCFCFCRVSLALVHGFVVGEVHCAISTSCVLLPVVGHDCLKTHAIALQHCPWRSHGGGSNICSRCVARRHANSLPNCKIVLLVGESDYRGIRTRAIALVELVEMYATNLVLDILAMRAKQTGG